MNFLKKLRYFCYRMTVCYILKTKTPFELHEYIEKIKKEICENWNISYQELFGVDMNEV